MPAFSQQLIYYNFRTDCFLLSQCTYFYETFTFFHRLHFLQFDFMGDKINLYQRIFILNYKNICSKYNKNSEGQMLSMHDLLFIIPEQLI